MSAPGGRCSPASAVHGLGAASTDAWSASPIILFHAQTWSPDCCYLQDLFTAEDARGQGVATALIDAVAEAARGSAARSNITG